MAVESRFVVIRNGVEVETFMDKKAADEYDKMLDMADSLSDLFDQSSLQLAEKEVEEISVFIAKHREDVLVALQAKKPKPKPIVPAAKVDEVIEEATVKPVKAKAKAKSVKTKSAEKE
ncbi:YebG family protein [Thalassotalea psychrophila]|uniref:YebG family protein n=1 Tax=Thalassotalea psychrophila TaxID=3065647 RepID=A0ABY9TZE1_9GAMM|nr:YebG family protein [Colwelliaceae bacterium SQ149]